MFKCPHCIKARSGIINFWFFRITTQNCKPVAKKLSGKKLCRSLKALHPMIRILDKTIK